MARPNIRQHQTQKILDLWDTNMSTDDIAATLGLSTASIFRTIAEHGLPSYRRESFKPHPNTTPDDVKKEILNMYTNDIKIIDISKNTGVSSSNISRIVKNANLTKQTKNSITKEDIIEHYKASKNINKTARHFKKSTNTITKVLRDHGVNTAKEFNYKTYDWGSVNLPELLEKHDGSLNAIQKELNVGAAHIKRYMQENQIEYDRKKFRSVESISSDTYQYGADMYHKGYTMDEIIATLEISEHCFKKWLQKNGIKFRRPIRVEEHKYEEFLTYSKEVRRLSKLLRTYCRMGEAKAGHHWNHKFSVVDCFRMNVPVDVASCPENQEHITIEENLKQGFTSKITLEELYLLRSTPRE